MKQALNYNLILGFQFSIKHRTLVKLWDVLLRNDIICQKYLNCSFEHYPLYV